MKKQLFVLFLCAASLPLCARPNTITMVTNFPGDNNLSYPAVSINKLDVLPTRNGSPTLSVGNDRNVALCVGEITNEEGGPQCNARGTTNISGEVQVQEGTHLHTGDVRVGTDRTSDGSEGRAEFGDLEIGGGKFEMGIGAQTLSLPSADALQLFPTVMLGGSNVFAGCDGAYWGRLDPRDPRGSVFLICGTNSETKATSWSNPKNCNTRDSGVVRDLGMTCLQASQQLPLVTEVPTGACLQMPGVDNYIAILSGSTLTYYSCEDQQ